MSWGQGEGAGDGCCTSLDHTMPGAKDGRDLRGSKRAGCEALAGGLPWPTK